MTLSDTIKTFQANSQIPSETRAILQEDVTRLQQTGLADHSKKKGDKAPSFALPNATGQTISFDSLLAQGPLVISFYRGAWCPYCNLELRALQQALPDIKANKANLIAISPNLPDKSLTSIEKHNLEFEVLSDTGNVVARSYGLVFTLGEATRSVFENFNLELPDYNGDDHWELPVPATYIINTDGTIIYDFVNVDYTKRAEPSDIVNVLQGLT